MFFLLLNRTKSPEGIKLVGKHGLIKPRPLGRVALFVFLFFPCFGYTHIDPFSKITVTSKRATFQKDKKDSSLFYLQYNGDVFVTFADKTTVSVQALEVFVEAKNLQDSINGR